MDNITVVSGYWNVLNKYSSDTYNNWFNTSLKINQRYIFFTEKSSNDYIQKFRSNYETIFVDYKIEDFYCKKYYKNHWVNWQHVPSKELGMIWHEKIHCMKLAKDNDKTPTEFYVWIDAGVCVFRDKEPPKIRLNLLDINSLPHDKLCYATVEEDYHNFAASVLIMHRSIIDKIHTIYYSMLEEITKYINDFRCGSDQFIHTILFKRFPNLYYKIADGYGQNLFTLYNMSMKTIILIGPGMMPIPPIGWGAIESIVWDYYENLTKKNINVIIINTTDIQSIINTCNKNNPNVVHIMYDDYISIVPYLNCSNIIYTSHMAYLTNSDLQTDHSYYYKNILLTVIQYQDILCINAISNEIASVYRSNGFNNKINIINNGAREDLFKFTLNPNKHMLSIYIGKIEIRKRQYKYQSLSDIDFIGNYYDSNFDQTNNNYLGQWDKNTIYNNLTEYGNLILLSDGEADSLVIKEALIAGLGVVISNCASANLNTELSFISVIPDEKLDDLEYIKQIIISNREYSIQNRIEIRNYALNNFSWDKIIDKYLSLI